MPTKEISIETIREKEAAKEEVVRQILRLTNPSTKLEYLGAVGVEGRFRTAAAGVALIKGIELEEAEQLLLRNVV